MFIEDKTGRPSSSIAYPPKLIYYMLKMYRNKISYEDRYLKNRYATDLNVELTLPCVELEEVDQIECPCAPASGCSFFKSKFPLPNMLNGMPNSVSLIKKQSSQSNYGHFTYVDWYNFEDKVSSRFKAQREQPYFTMKNIKSNRHLYVYANTQIYTNLHSVAVSGHFNDVLEVAAFPDCGGESKYLCDPLDVEFLIEAEIESKVFEYTYAALLNFQRFPVGVDIINNDNNDAKVSRSS